MRGKAPTTLHRDWIVFAELVLIVQAVLFLTINASSADISNRRMETLNRGFIAMRSDSNSVYLGWRLLGTDKDSIAFNLYRSTAAGSRVKLNDQPISKTTDFNDTTAELDKTNSYALYPVLDGNELACAGTVLLSANALMRQYTAIRLKSIPGYTPNDASVGDLDGDGQYEIVLHQSGRGRDNSQAGLTDPPIFQAYKISGEFLWEINLGKNIREGAHYTQFMVYDLDGDGKAEVAMKTADGTTDGKGKVIGDATKDYRGRDGKILTGPEFLTIFDGKTGRALATTDYIPPRGDIGGWGGVGGNSSNDRNGNRVDRFLACVAYLDGKLPSVIMCRGYYGRSVLAAWDWRNGKLTSRWVFDSDNGFKNFAGQGNHNLTVADVDEDGKDEIIYGAMCVDDDGKGLYTTGLRHGDAMHVSDLDPSRPGLEVWSVHENETQAQGLGTSFYSAKTGQIYWGTDEGKDVGRGLAADIDPNHAGAEMWGGAGGLRNGKGERIGNSPRSANFAVWWDGDLLRELLDRNAISKWDWANQTLTNLFRAEGCSANNGSKSNPALSADILGDWREEVIWRTADNKELRIYSTVIPSKHRMPTLMHDPQYRLSIAWQNVAYNQPPHTGFFLGDGMKLPRPIATELRGRRSPSP